MSAGHVGRAMSAADLRAHFRAWRQSAARELRILGLPSTLRPVQFAAVIERKQLHWLRADDAAEKGLRALEKHVHTCVSEPEAMRLLADFRRASDEASRLADERMQLMALELDYLRTAFWRDAWRDQVIDIE